ncbi:MAG: prepilin-type N-terminal cleavage/methylation domain-containing protein, partial [Verrucomicrobiae bacterium]|nr:prepilin-type N-terminal cleavage/methylation domain-containing protein [Verrucomicrobiae bacterium]
MAPFSPVRERARHCGRSAFTLLELLVVVGIIALLAATSVPAIRSLSKTNVVAAGNRQMLDDLAYARRLALTGRRTVYVVFVPPT